MLFDQKLDKLYKQLIHQWNIAERRIKKAEQVQGNEVVISAVFELRYAGRKLVDALVLLREKDWRNDPEIYDDICRFLADAIEDCVKAKHDAIDAALYFVTIWFQETEQKIGVHRLIEIFPEYMEVTSRVINVQDKIAESREDRVHNRDGIYDEIEMNDYDTILDLYDRMRISKPRVQKIVSIHEFREIALLWGTVLGVLVGAGLLGIEIYKLLSGPA